MTTFSTRVSRRFGHGAQTVGVVLDLQTLPHYLACLGLVVGIGPNRVIDVDTAAALLAKPGNAARGLVSAPAPHAEAAKTARIALRRGQRRRAGAAHRRLQDRPFVVQSLGQGVCRPHVRISQRVVTDVISGRLCRYIRNKLIDDLLASGLKPLPVPAQQSLTSRLNDTGDREWTALTAGQSAALARATTAAELIERLAD